MNNSDRLTPVQGPSAVACTIVTSLSHEATGRLSHATGQQQTTTQGDNRTERHKQERQNTQEKTPEKNKDQKKEGNTEGKN